VPAPPGCTCAVTQERQSGTARQHVRAPCATKAWLGMSNDEVMTRAALAQSASPASPMEGCVRGGKAAGRLAVGLVW
jgi:hypothetical protein